MIRILFLVIASLGLLAALGTVIARNLVHAALFLVAFFFLIACQFILLEVDFLAAIQVLVYIGAVAVLILFGIMLTRDIQQGSSTRVGPLGMIAAILVAVATLALMVLGINREAGLGDRPGWTEIQARPDLAAASPETGDDPRTAALADVPRAVGFEMMTRYVVAFETAGLLLTAAVVGAIALAVGAREPSSGGSEPDTAESPSTVRAPR